MSRDPSAFDLVICDLVMPFMGESEVARRIRLLRPGQPILFISGYDADPDLGPGDVAITGFLHKPFDRHELEYTVRWLIDSDPRLDAEAS